MPCQSPPSQSTIDCGLAYTQSRREHARGDDQVGQNERGHAKWKQNRLARVCVPSAHRLCAPLLLWADSTWVYRRIDDLLCLPQIRGHVLDLASLVRGDELLRILEAGRRCEECPARIPSTQCLSHASLQVLEASQGDGGGGTHHTSAGHGNYQSRCNSHLGSEISAA